MLWFQRRDLEEGMKDTVRGALAPFKDAFSIIIDGPTKGRKEVLLQEEFHVIGHVQEETGKTQLL